MLRIRRLSKSNRHDHFFTFDNSVHESYGTIRGLRYMKIVDVEYPDKDRLCEVDILLINSILSNR